MPKPTPLHEVLNNTKCYAIPDYQRDYAWHASNVETLCLDILAVAFGKETEDEHFIGTLVTVPFDKKEATSMAIDLDDSLYGESNEPRHVVDGQQRLATLSLIVKVLLDMVMEDPAIENPRARDSLRKRLEDMIYQAGPEQPGNFPFPILILNGNTGVVFNELLTGRKIPCNKKYTGAKRVNAAVQTIRKIIGDERHWQADLSGYDAYAFYNRIVETLHKKILLVEIECCDSINAFQVFDSLNGKGLDLTAADRIKNKVFSWAKGESARDKKREAWDRIVEKVGDQHVTDFLVSLVFARGAKRFTKNALPKEFGKQFEGEAKGDYSKFLRDLEDYADLYSSLRNPTKFRPVLRETLEGLSELKIEQVYTILLSAAMYYRDEYWETTKDMAAFFRQAEALVVRLQICDKSPNKLDPIFSGLIRKMADHVPFGDLVAEIEAEKRSIASDAEFVDCFARYATGNDAVGRFYMRRLDDLLRKKRGDGHKTTTSDKLTLEHIVPQSVDLEKWYDPDLVPAEVLDDRKETLINRLGNMALLSLGHNAALGNALYPEKRAFYMAGQKDGYCPMEWFDLIRTLVDKYPLKFRKEEVDERQSWMARLALEIW